MPRPMPAIATRTTPVHTSSLPPEPIHVDKKDPLLPASPSRAAHQDPQRERRKHKEARGENPESRRRDSRTAQTFAPRSIEIECLDSGFNWHRHGNLRRIVHLLIGGLGYQEGSQFFRGRRRTWSWWDRAWRGGNFPRSPIRPFLRFVGSVFGGGSGTGSPGREAS